VTAPLGYLIVRDDEGTLTADWDGEAHASYDEAARLLVECRDQEPLYAWFLVELRRAEVPS